MRTERLGQIVVTLLVLLLVMATGPVAASDDNAWDNVSPSERHKKLWEGKVQSLLNKAEQRRLETSAAVANTQTNYDVTHYDIFIRVNDTTEILYGRVGFTALAAENGVTEVQVDLYNNMAVDSIVAPSGQLSYSRSGDVVTVMLDGTYNLDDQFEFDFFYHGHPTEGGFQAFSFSTWNWTYPSISSLSEPYFARTWWPCKDRMDDKADTYDIAIEVDTSLYVASNGTLDSTVTAGGNSHTFHYSVSYPMVTYLFSVAISPFTVWEDEWVYNGGADTMPIVNAVFPDRYAYSLGKYDITPEVLTVLSDNFGQYPFVAEKYGHANFTWGGGMEHQTMTSMTGSDFGFSQWIIVHEAGHQWFGDAITCESWGHIWLNEGWASYSEALWAYHTGGWPSYHSYMAGMNNNDPGTIYVSDTISSIWNIFSSKVYDKGAWVCHMLRGVLGDDLFFDGINAYMNSEFYHAAATTEDFRDVFEAATDVELDWFFEDWIYGTYRPNYRHTYYQEPAGDGTWDVYVRIRQIQTTQPQVFDMPIDIYFEPVAGTGDTVTLTADDRVDVFKVNLPYEITGIDLDPSDWILKFETRESWTLHFVTPHDGLDSAVQYAPYVDTVEARGGTGSYTFSVATGPMPSGWVLSPAGVISGTTTDTGWFNFTLRVDDNGSIRNDTFDYSLYIAPGEGVPGDANSDGSLDPVDLAVVVDYLFAGGAEPPVLNLVDVNADCSFDPIDLAYFTDFFFAGGAAPQLGCVN